MTDRLHEQLSAFLDGELPAAEAQLLLARLERDPLLRATLTRYTLAGDALRMVAVERDVAVAPLASVGFAARLAAAVEVEAQQQQAVLVGLGQPATARRPRAVAMAAGSRQWLGALGGLAVAASVAGMAVWVLQRGGLPAQPPRVAMVASVSQPAAVQVGAPFGSDSAKPAQVRVNPVRMATATPSAGLTGFGRFGDDEPLSYTTPLGTGGAPASGFIPPAELASYVVAHAEVSGPFARRNVITGLVAAPAAALTPVSAVAPAAADAVAPTASSDGASGHR